MTKIKLEVEIEIPDDHKYGVSEELDGKKVIPKETVASMVRQNFWTLLNNAYCATLTERIAIEGQQGYDSDAMYFAKAAWNEAEQEIWRQIKDKAKVTIDYPR